MQWAESTGLNVKRLRLERGLSQEALAAEAGLAMRHLGRIERGQANPTLDVLERLAVALRVPPLELVSISAHDDPQS